MFKTRDRDSTLGQRRIGPPLVVGLLVVWLASVLPSSAAGACPNEAFRTGPSSDLPECRAYELVTPANSNGSWFVNNMPKPLPTDAFPTEYLSTGGDGAVFTTYNTSLLEPPEPNGYFDLYAATRTTGGWVTPRHLTPAGPEAVKPVLGGVSADHRYTFVHLQSTTTEPGGSLSEERSADFLGKPDGSFEYTGVGSLGVEPLAQGRYISPDGSHVIFQTGGALEDWCSGAKQNVGCPQRQLEPDAAPSGTSAVYDRAPDGPTRVISLLPGDVRAKSGEGANYLGASRDASAIAFEIGGTLYVRVDGVKTEKVAEGPFAFGGLSADGRYVFYVEGIPSVPGAVREGNIHRFDTEVETNVEINSTEDGQMMNVSADGSHVYFISKEQLDSGKGASGQPNVYEWSGGGTTYVATVLPSDLEKTSGGGSGTVPALNCWTAAVEAEFRGCHGVSSAERGGSGPGEESSRTTPEGAFMIFESRAMLTGYDNANPAACPSWTVPGPDQQEGTADDEVRNPEGRCTEIYRWDAAEESLVCLSCGFGHAPGGDARLQELTNVLAGAVIHNLSDDGSRAFFETSDPLVEADTDGVNDIYEWEEAADGGHSVALISSGKSTEYPPKVPQVTYPLLPNLLLGATPSGNDVTFSTVEQLVPQAPEGGSPAIYDARVEGGFAQPSAPSSCGDAGSCRSGASGGSPTLIAPLKSSGRNVKPRRHRCKAGKTKRAIKHERCHRRRHHRRHER
jgi:hypothetical protein